MTTLMKTVSPSSVTSLGTVYKIDCSIHFGQGFKAQDEVRISISKDGICVYVLESPIAETAE